MLYAYVQIFDVTRNLEFFLRGNLENFRELELNVAILE
jgi:hypothetical protein